MNKKNIKIFISYHKPCVLLKSDIFVPIHAGRAVAALKSKDGILSPDNLAWLENNMQGDDIGDNISQLNRNYAELTVQYFAWKNQHIFGNPDYVGFMHYRRHLNFNLKNRLKENSSGLNKFKYLNEKYRKDLGLDDATIENTVKKYDILTVTKYDVRNPGVYNIRDQYKSCPGLYVEDYDLAIKVLLDKYPDYKSVVEKYNKSRRGYFCNMFIMKTELFNEYCEWLFSILFECEKQISLSERLKESRVLAQLAERLFGIYILYLKTHNKNLKIKELQRTFVEIPEIPPVLPPAKAGEISIVMSADNNFVPYLAVTIQSVLENAAFDKYYSIYVLNTNISEFNQKKIMAMQRSNISIKFIDITAYLADLNDNILNYCKSGALATYFRFFVTQIFKNFDKVIYCDCDAVFLDDVGKLYEIDISNNLIAAVKDTLVTITHSSARNRYYYRKVLKLKNPANYINAGLLVFNMKEFVNIDFTKLCFETLNRIKNPRYYDQCILNILCEDKIYFLDTCWNVENHIHRNFPGLCGIPETILQDYIKAFENPKYLHFCGGTKPWKQPGSVNAEYFWKYARNTVFYEQILYDNMTNNCSEKLCPHYKKLFKKLLSKSKNFMCKHCRRIKQKLSDLFSSDV